MSTVVPELIPAPAAESPANRFAEAVSPLVMGPRLAAVVGAGPFACHVLDAKYEPGVRAVILYEQADRLFRGDLLTDADDLVPEGEGPHPIVAPGVRICAFPRDPDLPGLTVLMDAARAGPVLAEALDGKAGAAEQRRTTRCRISLLRYRPGRRATVLARLGARREPLVVKAYHDPGKAAVVAGEAQAFGAVTTTRGILRFAPPAGHVSELALVVQQAVRGTPLDVLLGNGRTCAPQASNGVRRAAQALAELHQAPAVSSRMRPVERELQRFGLRASRISTVDPLLGHAAAQLAERLINLQAYLPGVQTGPVHGDCKPSQFLLGDHHVYLLDLDHCGVSDQAGDVGTFLATLRQIALRHALAHRSPRLADELAHLGQVFLEAYLDRAAGERTRIRWQEAVALERKALRAFARAPRSPLAGALIREANHCLDTLRGAR